MHRTLKEETASPPKATWRRQQAAFDAFRHEFNHHRPHEALQQHLPAEWYVSSSRPYPLILPEMVYPDDMEVRWVKAQGDISWNNRHIYLSQTLAGEMVGLRQVNDSLWDVYFGPIRLAHLDTIQQILIHLPKTKRNKLCHRT